VRLKVQFYLFIALALTLSKPAIVAQDLNYTHFGIESEVRLPSNQVYGIVFGKNGVLWATTDRGVWRYDGYTSRQFTVSDGLKENTNLRIFPNPTGGIWVSSINNYLNSIIDDTVRLHPSSEDIHKLGNNSEFIQQISVQSDSSIYLCFNRPGLFRLKKGEKPVLVKEHLLNAEKGSVAIHYSPEQYYWDMDGLPDTNQNLQTTVTPEKDWIYLKCGVINNKNSYRKDICPIGKNEFLISVCNKAFHIKDGHLAGEKAFTQDVSGLFADKQGNFWIGLLGGGVLRFSSKNFNTEPSHYLNDEIITGIAQDHEGGYWFTTLTNGIFNANNLDINLFKSTTTDIRDNNFMSMTSDGRSVYVGTQSGLLYKYTELASHNYSIQEIKLQKPNGSIRKLYFTPDHHLMILNEELMEIDTLGRFRGVGEVKIYPFSYTKSSNGEWMVTYTGAIDVYKNSRVVRHWSAAELEKAFPGQKILKSAVNRIRTMLLDSWGRLWFGSQNSGLFSGKDSVIYQWDKKDTLLGRRILDIDQVGKNIWLSIADYGIGILHPDSTLTRITQKDGLLSDIIDAVFAENDSVVWVGTNNGLNRISFEPVTQKVTLISSFTVAEGLPSSGITQIIQNRDHIWVTTSQGVIDLGSGFIYQHPITPKLLTGPLIVNQQPRPLTSPMVLDAGKYDLVFNFKAITYRKPSHINYKYKLVGIDKDYIITNNLEARYPDLRHGTYTFCINASYTSEFDPFTEKTFIMEIKPHFYELKMMVVLYFMMLLALIYAIFNVTSKSIQTRELEKRQLLHAEKRALLSQMNPHFIFNSLNSIEHFILQHDEFQANNYLTNFSGLIRRILDNSKKNVITLQEEITTLCLYLGLEKLRFENEFENQIIKDDKIDYNETMIPPMLLQPFVENAIWHGLLPLKGKGVLTISFTDMQEYFKCCIVDNGIGRENALSLKGLKNTHVSNGIHNVEERIELLNKMNKRKISLTIYDLKRDDGTATGTSIEIIIPFELKT